MINEFSAGGIVVRKDSGQSQNDIAILVSQHSGHHGWVFPKGHVGDSNKNETPEEAALREVQEETGIIGKILKSLTPIEYWYQFQGEKKHKKVQYFLMSYVSGDIENHDFEMENVEWLPMEEVEKRLTYDGDKKVWEEAHQLIANGV